MSKKKLIALVIAAGMAFTACQGTVSPTPAPIAAPTATPVPTVAPVATPKPATVAPATVAPATVAPATVAPTPKLAAPLLDKKIEISYFLADENGPTPITDSLAIFKWIEERTNIKIKTVTAPLANYDEKLGTVLASGSIPDLMALRKADVWSKQYGPDGAFVDYLKYINDGKMPNLKSKLDKIENSYTSAQASDGKMYIAPRVYDYTWVTEAFIVRYDLLAKYKLAVPKTVEEFYEVLKVFKQNNPDSVPLTNKWKEEHLFMGFGRSFNTDWDMYMNQETKKWQYGPLEANYKDMLAYLAKLYKEGLLDKEFATQADADMDQKVINGKSFVSYNYLAASASETDKGKATNPDFLYKSIPMLTYNGKTRGSEVLSSAFVKFGKSISAKSKYVDELVKFIDWTYGKEGVMLLGFGVEGEHYTLKDGAITLTDKIAKNGMFDGPLKATYAIDNQNIYSVRDPLFLGVRAPLFTESEKILLDSKLLDKPVPIVTFTSQEELTNLVTPIRTYVKENATKIITGAQDISKWDEVVKELKKMGADKVVEMYQTNYDRDYKK